MNRVALTDSAHGNERRRDLAGASPAGGAPTCGGRAGTAEAHVRFVVAARRLRDATIGQELFSDPAWDMLLELYAASLAQRRLSTTDLILSSTVPSTTALRWIDKLAGVGLARRLQDPLDRRRTWVEITPRGAMKMRCLFETLGSSCSAIWPSDS